MIIWSRCFPQFIYSKVRQPASQVQAREHCGSRAVTARHSLFENCFAWFTFDWFISCTQSPGKVQRFLQFVDTIFVSWCLQSEIDSGDRLVKIYRVHYWWCRIMKCLLFFQFAICFCLLLTPVQMLIWSFTSEYQTDFSWLWHVCSIYKNICSDRIELFLKDINQNTLQFRSYAVCCSFHERKILYMHSVYCKKCSSLYDMHKKLKWIKKYNKNYTEIASCACNK